MSRLRIMISGEQGIGKTTIAEWLGVQYVTASEGQIVTTIDGEDVMVRPRVYPKFPIPLPQGVFEVEITTLQEASRDFADSLRAKVHPDRFNEAEPEIAHAVWTLLTTGALALNTAKRILSKSAKRLKASK